jgi:hypothetical protein
MQLSDDVDGEGSWTELLQKLLFSFSVTKAAVKLALGIKACNPEWWSEWWIWVVVAAVAVAVAVAVAPVAAVAVAAVTVVVAVAVAVAVASQLTSQLTAASQGCSQWTFPCLGKVRGCV